MESSTSVSRFQFAWTDETCETLRSMWADGGSMTDISKTLGCSRGAVSGKIDRLKLPKRELNGSQIIKRRIRPRPNQQTVVARQPWRQPSPIPIEEPVEVPSGPPPTAKPFDELLSGECRWPYGEALPYLFCAAPQAKDKSYCGPHCGMAYRATPPRQEKAKYGWAA